MMVNGYTMTLSSIRIRCNNITHYKQRTTDIRSHQPPLTHTVQIRRLSSLARLTEVAGLESSRQQVPTGLRKGRYIFLHVTFEHDIISLDHNILAQ